MNKKEKNSIMLNAVERKFRSSLCYKQNNLLPLFTKEASKLFNECIGIKLKNIRLDKGITAEAVIHDTDAFKTINGLYKFEKGIISVCKFVILCNYYEVSTDKILQPLIRKEDRCKNSH